MRDANGTTKALLAESLLLCLVLCSANCGRSDVSSPAVRTEGTPQAFAIPGIHTPLVPLPPPTGEPVHDLIQQLWSADACDRAAAVNDLIEIGEPAVPALLEAIPAPDENSPMIFGEVYACRECLVREDIARVLLGIDRRDLPKAMSLLDDPDPGRRHRGLSVLREEPACAREMLPKLIVMLDDPDETIGRSVLGLIERLGPAAEPAVPRLIEVLNGASQNDATAVVEALGAVGPSARDAVPTLVRLAGGSRSVWRSAFVETLGKIGPDAAEAVPVLIEAMEDGDRMAIVALGEIGPAAAPASRSLLMAASRYEGHPEQNDAAAALRAVGKACVPVLIDGLSHERFGVRDAAAQILVFFGAEAKEAVPALGKLLRDENCSVVANAAAALGKMSPESGPVLAERLEIVDTPQDVYRQTPLLKAIRAVGPAAWQAAPKLVRLMGETESDNDIEEALLALGPYALDAIASVLESLPGEIQDATDVDGEQGRQAARERRLGVKLQRVLTKIRPDCSYSVNWGDACVELPQELRDKLSGMHPSAVPVLLDRLKESETGARGGAILSLARMRAAARAAVVPLLDIVKSGVPPDATAAADALAKIGLADAHAAEATLIEMLSSAAAPLTRRTAAIALGGQGNVSRESLAALIAALKDDDDQVKAAVIESIGTRVPGGQEAIPALCDVVVNDRSPKLRLAAVHVLAAFGVDAERAIPCLNQALSNDPSLEVRTAVAETLGKTGLAVEEAIPALTRLVSEPCTPVPNTCCPKKAAVLALATIGEAASEAIPTFVELLEDPNRDVRVAAARALGKLGTRARTAVAPLRESLKRAKRHGSDYEESVVIEAIARIQRVSLPSGLSFIERETPSRWRNYRHYECSLKVEYSRQTIPLAGLYEYEQSSESFCNIGLDADSLRFQWLEPHRLLHVSWETVPRAKQTHLILLNDRGIWREFYRHTHQRCLWGGAFTHYDFRYQVPSRILIVQEEYWPPPPPAETRWARDTNGDTHAERLSIDKVTFLTEWWFQLRDGQLVYLDGVRKVDLAERSSLYAPEPKCTRTWRVPDFDRVAELLMPGDTWNMALRLRELNPVPDWEDQYICPQVAVFEAGLDWRGTDETRYYSEEE